MRCRISSGHRYSTDTCMRKCEGNHTCTRDSIVSRLDMCMIGVNIDAFEQDAARPRLNCPASFLLIQFLLFIAIYARLVVA